MVKEKEKEQKKQKRLFEEFMRSIDGPQPMEHESKRLLSGLGLPVPKGVFIKKTGKKISKEEVLFKTGGIGFPLAAKTVCPAIRSKSEAGGVRLRIETSRELLDAVRKLMEIEGSRGVLVEQMVEGGTEAIVGGLIDAQFGPVVMFGLGGIFTEVFRDVSFALAPTSPKEAQRLISRIKGQSVLQGVRGRLPVDFKTLGAAIVTVSRLMATGLIQEIDLNPLSLFPRGAFVLDAKIFVFPAEHFVLPDEHVRPGITGYI